MTDREEKKYNLFIGKLKNDGYLFLEYAFKHGDGFKGLVGFTLDFLTEEMLDERWDDYDWEDLRRDAVHNGMTELGLDDWVDNIERWDGRQCILDNSYCSYSCVDEAMEMAKEKYEEEYEYIDCSGGGRCFDETSIREDSYERYVPENLELLQKLYKEYEEK